MSTETQTLAPGTFCWVDLFTTDTAAARKFYGTLFHWQANDMGGNYSMMKLNDKMAGGITELPAELRQNRVPPHWLSYVQVTDAEQIAQKAASLGGTVLRPVADMGGFGRMAVLRDPAGAAFALWQPANPKSDAIYNVPGALCWNELLTTDTAVATKFYTGLFGWTTKEMALHNAPNGAKNYTTFEVNGRGNGGMLALPEDVKQMGVPSHWLPYFTVADTDNTVVRAKELGAQVHVPPTDIPGVGRFAVLADPQGAGFCILKLEAQPA
jgi:predicted enzyme related to lactoylglutathione lyase